ncbi:MAG: hypothetical protein MZU91_08090 [Desulfosudis oleivorans]|nr:hypothetical protein [Desulfosudis oleivorans]
MEKLELRGCELIFDLELRPPPQLLAGEGRAGRDPFHRRAEPARLPGAPHPAAVDRDPGAAGGVRQRPAERIRCTRRLRRSLGR